MPRYSIVEERFGDHEARRLSDSLTGANLLIARRGATLLRWETRFGDTRRTLSDGHQTPSELAAQSGMRFGVMAPFSNRIADARYRFDGEEYDLQPGVTGARGIRHGFVRHADFEFGAARADDEQASLTLITQVIRPGAFPGYPFAIDVAVTITLCSDSVGYLIEATNVGARAAPFGCGLHPYFRLADDGIESLQLQIPADTVVRTDSELIPLPGSQAYAALDEFPALDFRTPRAIAGRVIDTAYSGLRTGEDGTVRTRLKEFRSGASLIVSQQCGLLHAFSADTVSRSVRASMALEPVEFPTDAFNREECSLSIRLEPGETRSFRCGFEVENPR